MQTNRTRVKALKADFWKPVGNQTIKKEFKISQQQPKEFTILF